MERIDPLTSAQRSERMSRIRNADTKPEMIVRRLIHGMGYRYRLHDRKLPGSPDLVFRPRKKVIFVHGCFWHQHGCSQYRMPRSRKDFWEPKLQTNVKRDEVAYKNLISNGWQYMVLWECQLRDIESIKRRIVSFLEEQ